jgi:hypothetical protein
VKENEKYFEIFWNILLFKLIIQNYLIMNSRHVLKLPLKLILSYQFAFGCTSPISAPLRA